MSGKFTGMFLDTTKGLISVLDVLRVGYSTLTSWWINMEDTNFMTLGKGKMKHMIAM
jgi:hypothetical protein